MLNKIKQIYNTIMNKTIRLAIREYKFRKAMKEIRKNDPFIY